MFRMPLAIALAAAGLVLAAPPAQADRDTDFAERLHSYGIYGQRDYNAWIAKIACKRLHRGVDTDAYESAKFVSAQLDMESTTEQAWQFLGAAIEMYCPEQLPVLQRAATG